MISIRGRGLHTGSLSTVRFFFEEGPVRFKVRGQEVVPRLAWVVETLRSTTLGTGEVRLQTVEHLLAALYLRGIWQGLLIEVDGPELPILDGSAQEWLELLGEVSSSPNSPLLVGEPFKLEEGRSLLLAEPADRFELHVTISFPHPKIGYQRFDSPPRELGELASARTFGFLEEFSALRERGLAGGASLENTLVLSRYGYLNLPRGLDEPVRHKALDFLGDLYLIGAPLQGRFQVHRGSHRLHIAFATSLVPRLKKR